MILDLATKVNHLEQKCFELQRAQRNQKEYELIHNPPEFLQTKPIKTLDEWINKLNITWKNVTNILEYGFEKEIANIILHSIKENDPIIKYNNDIYIYKYDSWSRINHNNQILEEIREKIQSKSLIVYQNKKEEETQNKNNEELDITEIINDKTMTDAECVEFTNAITTLTLSTVSPQVVFNLIKKT